MRAAVNRDAAISLIGPRAGHWSERAASFASGRWFYTPASLSTGVSVAVLSSAYMLIVFLLHFPNRGTHRHRIASYRLQ